MTNKAPTFNSVSITASFYVAGPGNGARFGESVTGIADVNGDGVRAISWSAPPVTVVIRLSRGILPFPRTVRFKSCPAPPAFPC